MVFMAASLNNIFTWIRAEGKRGGNAVASWDGRAEALPLLTPKDPNPIHRGSVM